LIITNLSSGYLQVARPIYLSLLGFTPVHIGLLSTVATIAAALQPDERASVAGIIRLSSTGSRAIAPTLGGYLMQKVSTSLPLFVSASVLTLGNTIYYLFFRKVKPPEERRLG
jgi:hypothetical protein